MQPINFFDEEGDINPYSIAHYLWNKRPLLISVGIIAFIFSFYISNFVLEKNYTAESILTPVESKRGASGMSGSQIGNMIGLSLGGAVGVNNAQIAIETLRSKDFFKRISEKYDDLIVKLVAVNGFNNNVENYDSDIYDYERSAWISKPSFQSAWSKYNRAIDTVYSWERGGFLTVKFTHNSPLVASEILNIMIKEVNLVKRDRDVLLADKSLEYLLRNSSTITNADLKRATSELMQNQLKIKMFADISPYYLIEPLDSVYTPESPSSPNTPIVTLVITSIILFSFIAFMTIKLVVSELRNRAKKD